jgi:large subunit ribosomal protein L22
MAIQAHATAKYIRTSAQKAGLVMDLIRGRDVNAALATLRFARKSVAKDVEKVLRSAIANAQQKEGFGGEVERLFVSKCFAGQGPSLKRVRPAPMGRAFRVTKRTAHLTVQVAERPLKIARVAEETDATATRSTRSTRSPRPRRSAAAASATEKKAAAKKASAAKA